MGQQRKKVEGIAFGLYGIFSRTTRLMRKGTDLSAHAYASEGGRENNRFLAYSRCWGELRPLQFQLGMEDDTVNLIGVQKGIGEHIANDSRKDKRVSFVLKQYDH